ncbi:MAG: alpha/beta fold hydrolase [Cyanobacteria bacterium P01_A01_bin.17]
MRYATQSWRWIGSLGMLIFAATASPISAAEQIYVQYAALELSVPVAELEMYATEGRLSGELATFAEYLSPKQLEQIRATLKTKLNLPPQNIPSLLSTPVGEVLLARASKIIQSKSGGASPEALKTALVSAAADPDGLTLLSLMRNFPDAGIQIDITEGLALLQMMRRVMQQTNAAVALVQQRSADAASPDQGVAGLQALQQPGSFTWKTQTLQLQDRTPKRLRLTGKARQFPADLYLPDRSDPAPVIVISHGFSSDRLAYASLAQHLASHGFAVAVPEHPGSSAAHTRAWLAGEAGDMSQALEFIDRPLDVTFLLDQLARRSPLDSNLRKRLNLKQVGVVGHSFGGYTGLALGGGTLNFSTLRQDCGPQVEETLNISQILQCQALDVPLRKYALKDSRVKAVLAISPITSSIFGSEGLGQVSAPVMMVSGSMDTVTPSLQEQIQPFTWLPQTHKYLVLIESASHFSTQDERPADQTLWTLPPEFVGPTPNVARQYLKGLGTTFFQMYLQGQPSEALSSGAVQQLSQSSLPLSLIRQLSPQDLMPVLETARAPQ